MIGATATILSFMITCIVVVFAATIATYLVFAVCQIVARHWVLFALLAYGLVWAMVN